MPRQQSVKALTTGARVYLRKLESSDARDYYLSWLNDSEVQKFTRRRGRTTSMFELEAFLKQATSGKDYHLAICLNDSDKHIGNISLNAIDDKNKSGEISIMMGDRSEWGRGYAREAVDLLSQFAFKELQLHRLWAASPNPAFNKMIEKCGWQREGIKREAFLIGNTFRDLECWSRLHHEFKS